MKVDKNTLWAMVCVAAMAVLFGAYALHLGHNSVIIASVLGFLGTIAGYIYGKKEEKRPEKESEEALQV